MVQSPERSLDMMADVEVELFGVASFGFGLKMIVRASGLDGSWLLCGRSAVR
jgi:hypothetical protein